MTHTLKLVLAAFFALSTPLLLAACEDETALEENVEEMGDSIEDATDN